MGLPSLLCKILQEASTFPDVYSHIKDPHVVVLRDKQSAAATETIKPVHAPFQTWVACHVNALYSGTGAHLRHLSWTRNSMAQSAAKLREDGISLQGLGLAALQTCLRQVAAGNQRAFLLAGLRGDDTQSSPASCSGGPGSKLGVLCIAVLMLRSRYGFRCRVS